MNLCDMAVSGMNLFPDRIYRVFKKLAAATDREWLVEKGELYRYAIGRQDVSHIRDFDRVMVIRRGLYEYDYFNICFLNNVLALSLKAVSNGMVPRIEIRGAEGDNLWEQFFEQPFLEMDVSGRQTVYYEEKKVDIFPGFESVYSDREIKMWGMAYRMFVRLNEKADAYIQKEIRELLPPGRRVLGVLCRGTDYTEKKPTGHPVQPELEDILAKAEEKMKALHCEYIYLATEVGEIDRRFRERFPDKILINKRVYYDEKFREEGLTWIKDVHFQRENDDYLKGLEYLSSLYILSRCNGIVAGNCGGSQAAVFLNGGRYEDRYLFDLGMYP